MNEKTTMVLDVARLVHDAGGPVEVARICGRSRQGVHYWVGQNRMASTDLVKILEAKRLKWTDYMTPETTESADE